MAIMDIVIILMLLLGAVLGFKKGFVKTLISFVGVFVVLILSFYLRTPIVNFMYKYCPFFNFDGYSVWNVFLYESIAFLIVFILLFSILGIIINISGIVEKILNSTIVLGIISKILGAIAGILEMLVFLFIGLFVISRFNFASDLIMESKVSKVILARTPIISNIAGPTYNAFNEVYELQKKYSDKKDKDAFNTSALQSLVSHRVLSAEQAQELVKNGKIKIKNSDSYVIQVGG